MYTKIVNIAIIVGGFFGGVSGFAPDAISKPVMKTFKYEGDIDPVGYFDPLNLAKNMKEEDVKYLREAELHHGRVAMYSIVLMTVSELLDKDTLAINKLSSMSIEEQLPYWIGAGAFEFARMNSGWKNPFTERNGSFKLKKDYQPGNVLKMSDDMYSTDMLNKELSNGRLAMLGVLGYICQELVSGQPVFS